jgi:anti-sigma B factor antagonist
MTISDTSAAVASIGVAPVSEVVREPGRTLVALQGDLDLYNADAVRTALAQECMRKPRHLVVDLSAVAFVDSTALHELLAVRTLLPDRRALVLRSPSADVRRALAVTGIDRILRVVA